MMRDLFGSPIKFGFWTTFIAVLMGGAALGAAWLGFLAQTTGAVLGVVPGAISDFKAGFDDGRSVGNPAPAPPPVVP